MNKGLKVTLEILGTLALIAAIVLFFVLISSITVPAKAESANDFPSYWEHDAKLVRSVQTTLVTYGENVEIDGKFGAKTAQAVKNVQKRYGFTPTGVVDDSFAYSFQVENWPYNKGYTLYYMADLESIYERSDYEDLIYINLGGRGYDPKSPENTGSHLWLFRDGKLIADSPCITGNESKGYFTPVGVRHITGRKESASGRYSTYRWLVHLNEKIYIHSLLIYNDSSRDTQCLGAHQSDGSIRIPVEFAYWLYKNEPRGVTVVIDDRAYQPSSVGYKHLLTDDEYTDYADWEDEYDYYDEEVFG